jgi:hypothetical protein
MDPILLTSTATGGLAFVAEMFADRRLPAVRRAVVSGCFALAGFVFGVGIVACYLFRDGLLPDDNWLSGWPAASSFARAFVKGPVLLGFPLVAAGLVLRRFPRTAGQERA